MNVSQKLSSLRKIYIPLVTCGLLFIPFVVYQRYYVKWKERFLAERSFRILGAVGDQIEGIVLAQADKFRAAGGKFYESDQGRDREFRRAWWHEAFPNTRILLPSDLASFAPSPETWKKGRLQIGPGEHVGLRVSIAYFVADSPKASLKGELNLEPELRARLSQLAPEFFDDIVLTDETGRVLFQHVHGGTRLERLDILVETPTSVDTARPADTKAANTEGGQSAAGHSKALRTFRQLTRTSASIDIRMAGADYKLFLQPVRIALKDAGLSAETINVVACGIWRTDRFHAEAFSIPYPKLIWFVLILVTAFSVTWPFMKAHLMCPKERVRRRDLWVLTGSTLAGTALLTMCVLNAFYESREHNTINRRLEALAKEIQVRFERELKGYLREAYRLPSHDSFRQALSEGRLWRPRTDLGLPCPCDGGFHDYEQVFWTDGEGQQTIKLFVKPPVTPQTYVRDRDFFKVVSDPKPWESYRVQFIRSANTGEFQMALAMRFRDVLKASEPCSQHLGTAALKGKASWRETLSAQVLVTRPASVLNAILPPGYGFAVFDKTGRVQLHSEPIRNLQENFFEETGRDPYLPGVLFSGKGEHHAIEYMGESHESYVTTLAVASEQPLGLVVFRDTVLDRTGHLMTILFAGVLVSICAIVLVMVAIADLAGHRHGPPAFLWPRAERAERYLYLASANLMLIFSVLERMKFLSGTLILVCLIALVVAGLLLSRIMLSQHEKAARAALSVCALTLIATSAFLNSPSHVDGGTVAQARAGVIIGIAGLILAVTRLPGSLRKSFQATYSLAVVSLLWIFAAMPTIGSFVAARRTVQPLQERYEEMKLERALKDRRQQLLQSFSAMPSGQDFVMARMKVADYGRVGLRGEGSSHQTHKPGYLDFLLAEIGSLFLPPKLSGAELLALIPDRHDEVDESAPPAPLLASAAMPSVGPGTGPAQEPHDRQSGADRLAKLGVLWLLAAAMFGWIYAMAKRLFLPGSQPAPALVRVGWKDVAEIQGRYILIGHPRSGRSTKLGAIAGLKPGRDLRRVQDCDLHLKPIAADDFSGDRVIVLDHFDFNIDDPGTNLMRLQLVENLLYEHRANVIIASTVDPLYYFTEERAKILSKGSDPVVATQLVDRWSRVLSEFTKAEFTDATSEETAIVRVLAEIKERGPLSSATEVRGKALFEGATWRDRLAWVFGTPGVIALKDLEGSLPAAANARGPIVVDLSGQGSVDEAILSATLERWAGRDVWVFADAVKTPWNGSIHCCLYVGSPETDTDGAPYTPSRVLGFAHLVARECSATAYLRRMGYKLLEDYLSGPSVLHSIEKPSQLARFLLDRADSYYGSLWASMTENERLVLYQLAIDGWANPLNERAIQQLQRKEFIHKDAIYRIMNESFRQFVLSISSSTEIQSWRAEEQDSSWHSWRTALVTIFIGLGAWLLYAQKDLFQVTLTYILTLGGAITGVFNLLGGLQRKGDGGVRSA